jgi:hypothetical protein
VGVDHVTSPWSRNPADGDDVDDLDIVAERARRVRIRTLPGDRMRRGARILRWCALLLAAVTIAGQWLVTYAASDDVNFGPYQSGWPQFGQFLSGVSWSLGFAGLVFAASFIVAAFAARLDLESTLAEG